MPRLTLELKTSAELLGTEPDLLLRFIQKENLPGILYFDTQPQVSIFTLANLLNTTPETLMEWLEDDALAELIDEVEEDEWFEGQAGKHFYQSLVKDN